MLTVSVARQRILIYPAWLSKLLLSPSNTQKFIRLSHSINLRHLHTLVAEPVQCRLSDGRDLSAMNALEQGVRERDAHIQLLNTLLQQLDNVGTTA